MSAARLEVQVLHDLGGLPSTTGRGSGLLHPAGGRGSAGRQFFLSIYKRNFEPVVPGVIESRGLTWEAFGNPAAVGYRTPEVTGPVLVPSGGARGVPWRP